MKRTDRQDLVRTELMALASAAGGQISPRAVLDAAREAEHPLHGFFEWDDDKAGEAFRLVQASALIRAVKLQVVTEAKDPMRVTLVVQRAFYSMPSLRGSDAGSYVPAQSIKDPTELVAEVLSTIDTLRKKHATLTQLSGVWREVDKVRKVMEAPSPAKKQRRKKAA